MRADEKMRRALGEPAAEWLAFDAAHPELDINNIDEPPVEDPAGFRDAANAAKEESVRRILNETGLAGKITKRDYLVPVDEGGESVPVRVYRYSSGDSTPGEKIPTFVYFHGGGFLLGTPSTEDLPCSTWASLLGSRVQIVSVCYRHTPEHVFPTQPNDAWDGLNWVFAHAEMLGVDVDKVILGGVSSGGNLAAGVALRDVEEGGRRLKGLVLGMPWLVHRDVDHHPSGRYAGGGSMVQCRDSPIMSGIRYDLFTGLAAANTREDRERFSVGLVDGERLTGMPPTAVLVCGRDMLRDEGMDFAEKVEEAGTPTKKHVFKGLPHAFTKYHPLPSSKRFDELMFESIRWCLDDEKTADETGMWEMEEGKTTMNEK
ncbi:alpha/beta-hydrolase [Podospora aff. communis PSN243]|uniref:Alpha/beta-hydrolase n=1 Tax=Podospora aff. communis PSN243 TaxID=3040156 RepID=A0AAV9H0A8_9PEZI|nr:alpha/beta-hydrolase [Podospora aff. communis PSN243]